MRQLLYICFFVSFLVIAACNGNRYRRSLLFADSLSYVNPQQSLALLDSISEDMSSAPEHERMYYRLLCIKASDKAYIQHRSDSSILPLIDYYEHSGNRNRLAEVYYYAGSVYRDLNDAPRALDYFQKALDNMSDDTDLRLKSNAFYQVGFLFVFQNLRQKALESYKRAYCCDSILRDTVSMIECLRTIAVTYSNVGKSDSSLYYYKKAYNLAAISNNKEMVREVLGQMSELYIDIGDYEKAKRYLMPYIEIENNIAAQISNYSMAADLYFNIEQYDSAKYYCKELLRRGMVLAKLKACSMLLKIASIEKKWREVPQYISLYEQYADSLNKITATESVVRMDAMYNYQLREKENLQLRIERSRYIIVFLLVFVSLCAILVSLVFYNMRQKKKRLCLELQVKSLEQVKTDIFEKSRRFIESNKEKIRNLEKQLHEACLLNEELTKTLARQKADLVSANERAERNIIKKNTVAEKLLTSKANNIIRKRLEQNRAITNKDWFEIDAIVNNIIDDFKVRLYSIINLSAHEYRMCILIRMGLGTTEISNLLSRSPGAISLARKRLNLKMFGKNDEAVNLNDFIKSL